MRPEYENFTESTFSASTFDAVYAAAWTMNASIPELTAAGLSLKNYTFENSERSKKFLDILEKHLINISFTGTSVSSQVLCILYT